MFNIVKPGTKFDFMGKAPIFSKVSIALFVLSLVVIFTKGVNLGLDFAGGHEILMQFDKNITAKDVRGRLKAVFPGKDTAVQSYELPDSNKTFYLVRILRSEIFTPEDITKMEGAFKAKYGEAFQRLVYNQEAGDVVEVEFTKTATKTGADLSLDTLKKVVAGENHEVSNIQRMGRDGQNNFRIALGGMERTVVKAMSTLDEKAEAVRVEFVGPTVGKQLRDDGLLAVLYAMLLIMVYIAFRFDFFYSPGAILCLFHDAVITVALLSLIGEQFTLATIAGLLTLVGYSINDTIVVFDRIRETLSLSKSNNLGEILNQAINETLGRTLITSLTTLLACACLLAFGTGTVLSSFGLIMAVGILVGTYSSIYVASPVFQSLRERFGGELHQEPKPKKPAAQV